MKDHWKSTSERYDYWRSLILTHLATLINEHYVDAYYAKPAETKLKLFQACLTSVVLIMGWGDGRMNKLIPMRACREKSHWWPIALIYFSNGIYRIFQQMQKVRTSSFGVNVKHFRVAAISKHLSVAACSIIKFISSSLRLMSAPPTINLLPSAKAQKTRFLRNDYLSDYVNILIIILINYLRKNFIWSFAI